MRKQRDKREPGKERDAMDKMIQIAVDHLEMDAIIELDIYAEGFADGKKINNQ